MLRTGRAWLAGAAERAAEPGRAKPGHGGQDGEGAGMGGGRMGERGKGWGGVAGGGGGAGRRRNCYCLVCNVGTNAHMRTSLVAHVVIVARFSDRK